MWQELQELVERATGDATVAWTVAGASTAVLVGSLVLLPVLVGRLPRGYFASVERPPTWLDRRHPVLRVLLIGGKNVLGAVLLVAGLAMLVLPGQGLLTMFAAVILLSFPGKRRLELALVRRRRVLAGLNWLRRRARRPPLDPPPRG